MTTSVALSMLSLDSAKCEKLRKVCQQRAELINLASAKTRVLGPDNGELGQRRSQVLPKGIRKRETQGTEWSYASLVPRRSPPALSTWREMS